MKISKKWREMAEIYKRFVRDMPGLDFSEEAAMEAYKHESLGGKSGGIFEDAKNGYVVGKKAMDVTVASWKESMIEGTLAPFELFNGYPMWFLEMVGTNSICKVKGYYKTE